MRNVDRAIKLRHGTRQAANNPGYGLVSDSIIFFPTLELFCIFLCYRVISMSLNCV